MLKKYNSYTQLEEKMKIMGQFFSEYFRRTMNSSVMNDKGDFTLLELKGLSAFVDVDCEYTMSELSKNAHLPLPNMSAIVDRFEKSGIAERRRDTRDRRVVRVHLTEKGKKMLYAFIENRTAELERTLGKLSEKDRQQLFESLETALRILQKITD
jgi:DNA-binding MarR family transcriptional regulator